MSTTHFAVMMTALVIGAALGLVIAALLAAGRRADDEDKIAELALDKRRIDYLAESECSLMFNPDLNAWGLLDGQDKCFAAGKDPREALDRAREKETQA